MNSTAALTLALDPGRILTAQGVAPDAWQRQVLLAPANRLLLNCSRQSGKSSTVAALAVHTALFRARSLILLLSPSLRQSGELFRKVTAAYDALGRPVTSLRRSQTRLELANGSRVVCLPGREETVRSFSGVALLVIDEAARVAEDLYRSVRPMLAVSGGRLVCLSTPFGCRGFFWREWHDPAAGWQRVRVTWRDCPRITPGFIEEERRSLGSQWVAQEYETSFQALEGLVYPEFARCAVPAGPADLVPSIGGIDFGFRNPFAAVWGAADADGVLWLLGEHYERERTIGHHAARLPAGVLWEADPAGAHEIALLRALNVRVRPGRNHLRAGIAAVRARAEGGRLKVVAAACPNLLAEASLYRYPGAGRHDPGDPETPVDEHNHALAALRYLVARLDESAVARYRKATPATAAAPRDTAPDLWTPLG